MEEMNSYDWAGVSEAIVIWSGFGHFAYPRRDEALLVTHFGSAEAGKLSPLVKKLADDFYASDARNVAVDLPDMGNIASAEFKKKYPEVSDDAVRALSWCYTYDYK